MISLFTSLLPGLFKIGDKLIEDKDKKMEYAFKVQEMAFKQMEILINAKTYPWIDGLVKLSYAAESIIKGLFRPVASIAAMVFVGYCELNGITLSPMVETLMSALLPGWVVSRHIEKKAKKEDSDLGW